VTCPYDNDPLRFHPTIMLIRPTACAVL